MSPAVLAAVNLLAGALIACCCVLSWSKMTRRTGHAFRLLYVAIGFAGLAVALLPFFDPWLLDRAHALLALCFALFLALDRRQVGRCSLPAQHT